MIFRSAGVEAQWDTWCYFHNRTYYLYYLITELSPGEGFGVATSEDGVHWHDHGWVMRASDEMVGFLGTGSVWPDPKNHDRFICNYSEWRLDEEGKHRQNILFAWSNDLINWNKFGDEHLFRIDERFYERYGRWDCIFAIPRQAGGYWGTWTATPLGREDLGGGIGIGFSEDGLTWQALPPPAVEPDAQESGAMTEVNGKVHAMFGTGGMKAYIADRTDGTYRIAEQNALLLTRSHSYFSRLFNGPDGLLVNHHVMDGRVLPNRRPITYAAPFKRFSVDESDTQRWHWWDGNNVLMSEETDPNGALDLRGGCVVETQVDLKTDGSSILQFAVDDHGYAITTGTVGAVYFIAEVTENEWQRQHMANRAYGTGAESICRILMRRGMLELYVNDFFIECWSMGCPDGAEAWLNLDAQDPRKIKAWHMGVH